VQISVKRGSLGADGGRSAIGVDQRRTHHITPETRRKNQTRIWPGSGVAARLGVGALASPGEPPHLQAMQVYTNETY
jgi:hypothetical protein